VPVPEPLDNKQRKERTKELFPYFFLF